MRRRLLLLALQVAAVVAVIYIIQDGIHYLNEPDQVIITQFGEPVRAPITTPGLYFDLPIIQSENTFDKRALEYQSQPTQVPTRSSPPRSNHNRTPTKAANPAATGWDSVSDEASTPTAASPAAMSATPETSDLNQAAQRVWTSPRKKNSSTRPVSMNSQMKASGIPMAS